MTREQYINITRPFREDHKKAMLLEWSNWILTGGIFVTYPCILILLFLRKDAVLIRTILVPLIGFIALTLFRKVVNRKRPYEAFEIESILTKDTKGESFPSRHAFSAMVIAVTICGVEGMAVVGAILIAAALLISLTRVLAGLHYPSDVIAGMLCAGIAAAIGFLIG